MSDEPQFEFIIRYPVDRPRNPEAALEEDKELMEMRLDAEVNRMIITGRYIPGRR